MAQGIFNRETFSVGKVVCLGRNYAEHIEELGSERPDHLVVFIKPASAIGTQLQAFTDEPLHYEGELCFLIRQGQCAGVGFGLDLTKRSLQTALKQQGLPWERAKAFDGSALFSEFVPLPPDLSELSFSLTVDGVVRQQADPALMLFPIADALEDIQSFMTLADNDILMSGTPKGVGAVQAGSEYIGKVFVADELVVEHRWRAK